MAQLSINTGATVSPLQGFPGIAQASPLTDSSFFGALMDGFSVETASAAGAESPSTAEVSNALPEATQDAQSLLESNGLLATAQAPASIVPALPVPAETAVFVVMPAVATNVSTSVIEPSATFSSVEHIPGIATNPAVNPTINLDTSGQNNLPSAITEDSNQVDLVPTVDSTKDAQVSYMAVATPMLMTSPVVNAPAQSVPVRVDEGITTSALPELAKVANLVPSRAANQAGMTQAPETAIQLTDTLGDGLPLPESATVAKVVAAPLTDAIIAPAVNNKVITTVVQTTTASNPAMVVNASVHNSTVDKAADKVTTLETSQQPVLGETNATLFSSTQAASTVSAAMKQHTTTNDAGQNLMSTTASTVVANLASSMQQGQHNADTSKRDQSDSGLVGTSIASLSSDGATTADDGLFSTMLSSASTGTNGASVLPSSLFSPLSLRQPQWTSEMGHKMQMMVSQKVDEVEVRVDPLDLGPVRIHLKMDESNKAHVTLSAQHGLTREMLENALPRLRDILSQQGIELGSANVDSQTHQDTNGQSGQQAATNSASDFVDDVANPIPETKRWTEIDRLVDQFA